MALWLSLQIPNHVAIKIALELKKLLIDNSLLDVYVFYLTFLIFHFLLLLFHCHLKNISSNFLFSSSQSDLEANLFKVCSLLFPVCIYIFFCRCLYSLKNDIIVFSLTCLVQAYVFKNENEFGVHDYFSFDFKET